MWVHGVIIVSANNPTNGATSYIVSPSSSLCINPNSTRSNLPSTQITNLSSSSDHNNSHKFNCPNNLDVALQAFIQRFIPSDSANVGQILQGITRKTETGNLILPQMVAPTSSTASSMTVVHTLDHRIFSGRIMKHQKENEVLYIKAQIATLKS